MLVFLLSVFSLNGQYSHLITTGQEKTTAEAIQGEANVLQSFEEEVYLEDTINPDEYIVGPGDEFAFNMLSSDGIVTLPLKVSPTGEVLIPAVGVIAVDKITLNDAFERIRSRCKEKYGNAKINMTLVNIRKFKVQAIGTIKRPGFVVVSPINRVSDVFSKVEGGGLSTTDNIEDVSSKDVSSRNIILWRNEKRIHVDLVKFNMFGMNEFNPQVQQGDIIEFHLKRDVINIFGGVELHGTYEYVKGETLHELIQLAGGYTNNADSNKIEITRFINDLERKKILLQEYGEIKTFGLEPDDHILVRYKKDFRRQDLVHILGEINYPGMYSIDLGKTTIGDVIKRAGGYTTKADSLKIIIQNRKISAIFDIEFERITLIPFENRSDDEKSYMKARLRSKKGELESNSEIYTQKIKSYVLNANDIIKIPEYFEFVEILGAVVNPGRYPFIKSMNVYNYVEMAGGLSETATRKKYIIKTSTGLRLPLSRKVIIENGDIIFVSEKLEYNKWTRTQEIMTTLGQMAAIIMVIQNAIGN